MQDADPFVMPPQLWFGLLCEGAAIDSRGRMNFQSVFNQVALQDIPDQAGVPSHAYLNGILAVGFSGGLGHFQATIEIRDIDDQTLWERPSGVWEFDLGPEGNAAVLIEPVRYWFTQPGAYHFWIRLQPSQEAHLIRFQVGRQIGPRVVGPDTPPDASPDSQT